MAEKNDPPGTGKRRDPRAERERRRAPKPFGPDPETPESAPRSEPRAERKTERAPPDPAPQGSARPRKDPRAARRGRNAAREAPPSARTSSGPSPKKIEHPVFLIGVVPDLPEGRPSPHDRDVLAVARHLAGDEGAVLAIIFTQARTRLGRLGIDRVMRFDTGSDAYRPEWTAAAVAGASERLALRHVLFPDSLLGGADIGRRVAAHLRERPATHVFNVDRETTVRRSGGDSLDTVMRTPRVLLIAPEADELPDDLEHEALEIEPIPCETASGIVDEGHVAVDPNAIALGESAFILAGGHGVDDWGTFRALSEALGATMGGSRVACDEGHLPRERQVGATGTIVRSRAYLALGISGAPQHLQGIADCEHVISVNQDPQCAMHKRADLAVVGDVQAIMPALLRLAAAESDRKD